MVEIRIYGKLRRYLSESGAGQGNVVKVRPRSEETLEQLLARIGIPQDEIYTIFLNSRLLVSRSNIAYWMRYQQVRKDPLEWNLNLAVKSGDRIGLFGRDMAALVV